MNNLNFVEFFKLTEDEAREYLEKIRWSGNIACVHCGSMAVYKLNPKPNSKRPVRKGVYKCKDYRKQFTVTVGTIFEGSHVPLRKWLIAIALICASKKGISVHQLHRMLGITYKSAWFIAHRIRYAMTKNNADEKLNGIVEADETYIGGKSKGKRGHGAKKKTAVFTLIERKGNVHSQIAERITSKNLKNVIRKNVDFNSIMITDDFSSYIGLDKEYKEHYIIKHSEKEYVRGNVHTNTVEGYFSILKRGINGIYHRVSKKHLNFYLKEFDFRYNFRKLKDEMRTDLAINGFEGKRLYYRDSS
ncbi:MAG: IS1595 family transposase [Promethearchaeota archaeon]